MLTRGFSVIRVSYASDAAPRNGRSTTLTRGCGVIAANSMSWSAVKHVSSQAQIRTREVLTVSPQIVGARLQLGLKGSAAIQLAYRSARLGTRRMCWKLKLSTPPLGTGESPSPHDPVLISKPWSNLTNNSAIG